MRALAGQALAPLFRKSPEKALRGGLRALVAGELALHQGFLSRRCLLGCESSDGKAMLGAMPEEGWLLVIADVILWQAEYDRRLEMLSGLGRSWL